MDDSLESFEVFLLFENGLFALFEGRFGVGEDGLVVVVLFFQCYDFLIFFNDEIV